MNSAPVHPLDLPLPQLAEAIRTGRTTSVEVVGETLARIARADAQIGAVVSVDAAVAMQVAGQVDQRVADGHLDGLGDCAGVPMLVKDLSNVAGMPTTFGARSMTGFVPPFDDHTVERMRAAGFVIIGKTATPELGSLPVTESLLHGATRSPWSQAHSAGGSSGGAAAAVAAGYVPAAHGSDGGGSIRIPASCCGVVGMKPSRGRVSHAPLFGEQVMGFSTQGPVGRRVVDVARLLDVLEGYATGDPYHLPAPAQSFLELAGRPPRRLSVGLVRSVPWTSPSEEVSAALTTGAEQLTGLGHDVVEFTPSLNPRVIDQFTTVWSAAVAASPLPREQLEAHNIGFAARGDRTSAPELLQCLSSLQMTARAFTAECDAFDVVLAPVLMRAPLRVGELDGLHHDALILEVSRLVGLTPVINVTGQPAISLPVHVSRDGLPIGIQMIGSYADDALLLQVASQLEQTHPWPTPPPLRGGHSAR